MKRVDEQWDAMSKEIEQYKNKYGYGQETQGVKNNPKLIEWSRTQREKYKKGILSKERLELLEKTGFVWKVK